MATMSAVHANIRVETAASTDSHAGRCSTASGMTPDSRAVRPPKHKQPAAGNSARTIP
jgi:hypothetical protein